MACPLKCSAQQAPCNAFHRTPVPLRIQFGELCTGIHKQATDCKGGIKACSVQHRMPKCVPQSALWTQGFRIISIGPLAEPSHVTVLQQRGRGESQGIGPQLQPKLMMLAGDEKQGKQLSQGQPPSWHIKRAVPHPSVANSEKDLGPQWARRDGWAQTSWLAAATYVTGSAAVATAAAAVATAAVTAAAAAHHSDRRCRCARAGG